MEQLLDRYYELLNEIESLKNRKAELEKVFEKNTDKLVEEYLQQNANNREVFDLLSNDNTVKSILEELDYVKQEILARYELMRGLDIPFLLIQERFEKTLPIVLFPLKVQTRFVTVKHIAKVKEPNSLIKYDTVRGISPELDSLYQSIDWGAENILLPSILVRPNADFPQAELKYPHTPDQRELWVRIYPDDILIETHEEHLSESEISLTKTYWQEVSKVEEADMESSLEKKKHLLAAWRSLCNSVLPSRAMYLVKQTESRTAQLVSNPDGTRFVNITLPETITKNAKKAAWSQTPSVRVLPSQFIVRLYKEDGEFRDYLGEPVPDELPIGANPSTDGTSTFQVAEDGTLKVPEYLKWMTDFQAAERIGMGIRIPLKGDEITEGFKKMLILGINYKSDFQTGKQKLEGLFKNHQYKVGGMSFLDIGTPTNNSSKQSSPKSIDDLDASVSFELLERNLRNQNYAVPFLAKALDGDRLATLLGLDRNLFDSVLGAEQKEISNAIAMNKALSTGTLGYFFPQFFPAFYNGIQELEQFIFYFNHFISARGSLPSVRIDKQPYGFLTATAYSKLNIEQLFTSPLSVGRPLKKLLRTLDKIWTQLVDEKALYLGNEGTISDLQYLLRQSPTSRAFRQRLLGGKILKVVDGNLQIDNERIRKLNKVISDEFQILLGAEFNTEDFQRDFESLFKFIPLRDGLVNFDANFLVNWDAEKFKENEIPKNYINWLKTAPIDQIRQRYSILSSLEKENKQEYFPSPLLFNYLRFALLRGSFLSSLPNKYDNNGGIFENLDALDPYNFWSCAYDRFPSSMIDILSYLAIFKNKRSELSNKIDSNRAVMAESYQHFRLQYLKNYLKGYIFHKQDNLSNFQHLDSIPSSPQTLYNKIKEGSFFEKYNYTPRDYSVLIETAKTGLDQLEYLVDTPIKLQYLFTEHLDLFNHRLDAWWTGFAYLNLIRKRFRWNNDMEYKDLNTPLTTPPSKLIEGNYYGAYAYLEEIKPDSIEAVELKFIENLSLINEATATISPIIKEPKISKPLFVYLGNQPSIETIAGTIDKTIYDLFEVENADTERPIFKLKPRLQKHNEGFIPAPTLDHAITAAILKSGHTVGNGMKHKDASLAPLAIDLSSERVRTALFILEGVKNGQTLAQLLGYRFERILREQRLEKYIYPFRQKYPSKAENLSANISEDDIVKNENQTNVVNGWELIQDFRKGLEAKFFEEVENTDKANIKESLQIINTALDGLADLLTAESIYQITKGNMERAAAALKIMGGDGSIHEPIIQETPRRGYLLKFKLGYMSRALGRTNQWRNWITPYSQIYMNLNQWILRRLPDASRIVFRVQVDTIFKSDSSSETRTEYFNFSLRELLDESLAVAFQPIDLVDMIKRGVHDNPSSELLHRITYHVIKHKVNNTKTNVEDFHIQILEQDRIDFEENDISLYELYPLINTIDEIIRNARPLRPVDLTDSKHREIDLDDTFILKMKARYFGFFYNPNDENLALPEDLQTEDINLLYHELGRYSLPNLIDKLKESVNALNRSNLTSTRIDNYIRNTVSAHLCAAARFSMPEAIPDLPLKQSSDRVDDFIAHVEGVIVILEKKLSGAKSIYEKIKVRDREKSNFQKFETFQKVAEILFGEGIKIYPEFNHPNTSERANSWKDKDLQIQINTEAPDWIDSLAPIRSKVNVFQRLTLLQEGFDTEASNSKWSVFQTPNRVIPRHQQDKWMGLNFDEDVFKDIEGGRERFELNSFVSYNTVTENKLETPIHPRIWGMVFDEWSEFIPYKETTLGMAMHYDQPNAEAPQTVLIATSPEIFDDEQTMWKWEDLVDTVIETMELAKKRTVQPEDIQKHSILSQFLPALIAPKITTNLSLNLRDNLEQ